VRSPRSNPAIPAAAKPPRRLPWGDMLDLLALSAWSAMLFRYWFGGLLLLLLHPDYAWLSNLAAIVLVILVLLLIYQRWFRRRAASSDAARASANAAAAHTTLLPPNLSSALLLAVAVFGLIYTPQAFSSETASQRGAAETMTLTRAQPQRFARAAAPEDRTLIDWMRLINVYPEPDAYAGEAVDLSGFVMHPAGWPDDYLMVSRFVLTCCAADAYPVGLPVKLEGLSEKRSAYPVDSWVQVQGQMASSTVDGRRQLAIAPTSLEKIKPPKNPYEY
jgi:uncharacterized repeat protein (TIGR03943 family)